MTDPIVAPEISARFEVREPLGRGAFGHTFLAWDRDLDRRVAIKVVRMADLTDWKSSELFAREAATLRALRHANIPEVYDCLQGRWDGSAATVLVMEYVEGRSLADRIESGEGLSALELLRVFLDFLGILDYLHTQAPPILHRDIKPANILLRPRGDPVLVDFGSVRRTIEGDTNAGSTIAGTYGYMPYEQYMGQATPSSDLYALGATMLHLLTGRPPREFMTEEGRIAIPIDLPGDPRLPPILAKLLHPSPSMRFQSAAEVREVFLAAGGSTTRRLMRPSATTAGRPVPALPPAPRPLTGETKALFKRTVPSALQLMDGSNKTEKTPSIMGLFAVGFFSVLTAGMLPVIFVSVARARRRRLKRFCCHGTPGIAVIQDIVLEPLAFGERLARVAYEFQVDGTVVRDTDKVMPVVADRWRTGDLIDILYLPDGEHDSVIIGTSTPKP